MKWAVFAIVAALCGAASRERITRTASNALNAIKERSTNKIADFKNTAKISALDTQGYPTLDISPQSATDGYLLMSEYNDACVGDPMFHFGIKMGVCEKVDDFGDYKSMALGCGLDSGNVTLSIYAYENKDCSGNWFSFSFNFGSEGCDENGTMTCTADNAPWDSQGLGTLAYFFANKKCSSDAPLGYALILDQCTAFDDDESYSTTCTASGIQYAHYSNSDCSSSPDQAVYEKFAKCKKEYFFDDDYYYYDDDGDDDDYYYDDDGDLIGDDSFAVSCCTYDQSVCEESMDQSTGDDENVCFAATEQVMTPEGPKAISEVHIGESVLAMTAEGSFVYSEVVYVPHAANSKAAQFIDLATSSASVRATKGHLLPAGVCGGDSFPLRAIEDVSIGQCVLTTAGEARVTGSESMTGRGVYTVVTKEANGHIVVNGIVASSFGVNHAVANAYYHLHRTMYSVSPSLMQKPWLMSATILLGDIGVSL